MLFNSLDFGVFLVIVFTMYWAIGNKRRVAQNVLILIASYIFYGLWDWRFLSLIIGSSLVDYMAALYLHRSDKKGIRRFWMGFSLFWNLGVLFVFKYMNFFLDNFYSLFNLEVIPGEYTIWNIIIPVGLSFYTFQTLGYTIDVYRKKLEPTTNLLNFLCFVSFFPQLVAGPIERANFLLPQFMKQRNFDYTKAKDGLRQILWGLFKKILVADKLGIAVSMVFNEPENYGTSMMWYASLLFFFQLYCDFSGYTDIAIGTAKLFGFKLNINFKTPFLSFSVRDFWRRWHITLTNWFIDYVYKPIVSRGTESNKLLPAVGILFTMVLVGAWHGANWTFIVFGLINGLIVIGEQIPLFKGKITLHKKLKSLPKPVSLLYFYFIATVMCMFFRSEDISQSFLILKRMFTWVPGDFSLLIGVKIIFLLIMLIAETAMRHLDFPLQNLELKLPRPVRWAVYYLLVFGIIRFYEPLQAFIYFQF
ncbi:MBOAT family protein [Aureitalea sp. L0-47]|uniref:MBOAT family O-acyltransferase n=1 Tax=Aureitalea sp. L0-47 TaxID=2816962 RepID=UPI0022388B87|nr:MBOAT family O-acyltransferase [Aureitalea sp. L0-47]MCW5520364.1 MBOAT family protein [Aureitalea sp. L0-47]